MDREAVKCQKCDERFFIDPEDSNFYERIKVPPPTWCPMCRFQRRACFRNERKVFRVTSGISGKNTLSLFPPSNKYKILTDTEWHSDAWDPSDYSRNVDFSRPFLSQFFELSQVVPRFDKSVLGMVNSDYSANASYLKNCYLLFNSNQTEDSAYGNGVDKSRNCYDNSHIRECERCYGSFWLTKCYETHFSIRCEDSNSLWFCKDCRGCSDCFGCDNLRNKKYHIFNQPYTKEEYKKKIGEFNLHTKNNFDRAKKQSEEFWIKFPNKFIQGFQNTNVAGEYISHSKNVHASYLIREGENIKYSQYLQVPPSKDIYDMTVFGLGAELFYEDSVCGWGGARIKFSYECWSEVHDLEYCMLCQNSSDLFGCFGMRNKKYCILNKQYTKEEYEMLIPKIKKHMEDMPYIDSTGRVYKYGEFFPPEMSPVPYNYSMAPDHFPLTKEEALRQGFTWYDSNPAEYETTYDSSNLPDSIKDLSDEILKEVIKCENCGRAYRLIAPELAFLRQIGIPAPRACIDCRHTARIANRNKANLYKRNCDCAGENSSHQTYSNVTKHFHGQEKCPNTFETSYELNRPEVVYCEQCYQNEVI